jgi:hypothetical protein
MERKEKRRRLSPRLFIGFTLFINYGIPLKTLKFYMACVYLKKIIMKILKFCKRISLKNISASLNSSKINPHFCA